MSHVEIEKRLFGGNLGISHPTESFIPLRTVHRVTHHVAFLGPEGRPVNLVDQFIVTAKAPGGPVVGMDHASFCFQYLRKGLIRGDLCILKTKEGKMGFVNLYASAFQNIFSGSSGIFIAGYVKISGTIQLFGISDTNLCAPLSFQGK